MKKYLPPFIKQYLWRVFKSPERKMVGLNTLFTDIVGKQYFLFNFKKKHPITICIGIKNRSHNLINVVIQSLNRCDFKEKITLSIFDAGSTDIDDLEKVIKRKWKGPFIYTKIEQPFARSKTFNQAILQAKTELIMACDADIYLPKDIVKKVNTFTTKKTAWFPILWWQNKSQITGRFFTEGTGIFSATKSNFIKAGMYDESITEWGKEDWLLYFSFYQKGIACFRTKEKNMVHHFHPSLKPKDFKALF